MSKARQYRTKTEISKTGLEVTQVVKTLFTATSGTLLKGLLLSNLGDYDTVATVKCYTGDDDIYRQIVIAMLPKQNNIVFDNYAIMAEAHYMTIQADSDDVTAILSTLED